MSEMETFTPHRPATVPTVTTEAPTPQEPAASPSADLLQDKPDGATKPSIVDLLPHPVGLPEEPAAPESEPEPEEEEDEFDFDPDTRPAGQQNEDRAARRLARESELRLKIERDDLMKKVAELEQRQIGPEEIDEWNVRGRQIQEAREVAHEKNLEAHYLKHLHLAQGKARSQGIPVDEWPQYDEGQMRAWVQAQKRAAQPPVTPELIQNVVESTFRRLQAESIEEVHRLNEERVVKQRQDSFEEKIRAAAKADGTGTIRRHLPEIRAHAKESGYKFEPEKYVSRYTGAERKVGTLAAAARAEHARRDVPLKAGGSSRRPSTATDPVKIVQDERMEPVDLINALRSGRFGRR